MTDSSFDLEMTTALGMPGARTASALIRERTSPDRVAGTFGRHRTFAEPTRRPPPGRRWQLVLHWRGEGCPSWQPPQLRDPRCFAAAHR